MATGGLYGSTSTGTVSPQSGSESTGLYGNNTVFGGTYFEWFVFQESATAPDTPTDGSWSFTTNVGTPPTGWSNTPPASPANKVWVSIALVNSKITSTLTWSTPGVFSILTAGTVTSVAATVPSFLSVSGSPITSSGTLAISYSGTALPIANGGTGATTASAALTALGAYAASNPSGYTSNTGTVTNVSELTLGTSGTDVSSTVANSTTTPVITLNLPTASSTSRGLLSSSDWTTFNNKGSGTVTSVTGTSPVVSSGGTTPAISIPVATSSANGYLSSTDWTTFNSKQSAITLTTTGSSGAATLVGSTLNIPQYSGNAGTVTSVAASVPSFLSVSGSPITSSGTLAITYSGTALPVANGGTGATTAGGALTALGAIGSVASADGTVSVTQTGTAVDLSVTVAASANNVICQVRNTTGATLTKGTVVYISGATGQIPTVSKALATSDATSAQTLGCITADLANNANGYVTIIGLITNIDTSAYTDGQQLYLSGTTAGTLTGTKPYAPIHLVYVAVVEYAHAINGKLFVKVQNGYELDEIHNVSAQTPSNGQTIIWDATTSLWEAANISAGTGISVTNGAGSISLSLATSYGDTQNPYASKTANYVLASPNGSAGSPTFRALVAADVPTLNQNTTGTAANVTATSNSTLTTLSALSLPYSQLSGTVPTWNQNTTGTASNVTGTVAITNGGTGATSASAARTALGLAIGTDVQDYSANLTAWAAETAPTGTPVGDTDTQTLTNKRITKRVTSITGASGGTITPTSDTADQYNLTALGAAATFAAPSGTPTNGQMLMLRIKDNGTARTLSWTTTAGGYRIVGVVLPTTTVATKTIYIGCVYNLDAGYWDVLAVTQEA